MSTRGKLSLRARVALTFALIGGVVSTCLAFIAIHFSDAYVNRLVREMLRVEGEYVLDRYRADGRVPRTHTQHIYTFISGGEARDAPPAEFAAMVPGSNYEISKSSGDRHIAVYQLDDDRRLYLVLDLGLEATRERRLSRDLAALVAFGTLLSAWLGWFLAGRAIDPVRRLAQRVDVLEPSRGGAVAIARDFANDEVGKLAQAFDRYQQKLFEYVRRERTFTADASHELRTPLAVIRGAIEVMMDAENVDAPSAARLKRMQRGADELRDLLDALLVLARSDEPEVSEGRTPDLDDVVTSLLGERAETLREKRFELERERLPGIAIAAPQKVLRVIIGNLLRAVSQFAEGGLLRVSVTADALRIAHEGSAVADPKRHSIDLREHALGLGMIRRVCERWGWALEEKVDSRGGHAFVLRFVRA